MKKLIVECDYKEHNFRLVFAIAYNSGYLTEKQFEITNKWLSEDENHKAVFLDEGEYKVVKEIMFDNPSDECLSYMRKALTECGLKFTEEETEDEVKIS